MLKCSSLQEDEIFNPKFNVLQIYNILYKVQVLTCVT